MSKKLSHTLSQAKLFKLPATLPLYRLLSFIYKVNQKKSQKIVIHLEDTLSFTFFFFSKQYHTQGKVCITMRCTTC